MVEGLSVEGPAFSQELVGDQEGLVVEKNEVVVAAGGLGFQGWVEEVVGEAAGGFHGAGGAGLPLGVGQHAVADPVAGVPEGGDVGGQLQVGGSVLGGGHGSPRCFGMVGECQAVRRLRRRGQGWFFRMGTLFMMERVSRRRIM